MSPQIRRKAEGKIMNLDEPDTTAAEIGLTGRLERLMGDARIDPDALGRIRERATSTTPRRPGRPVLLAMAACTVVVAGLVTVVLSRQDDPGPGVRTSDTRPPSSIGTSSTTSSTATTAPPEEATDDPSESGSERPDDPTTPADEGTEVPGGSPPATDPQPARANPLMTLTSSEYTVEVVLQGSTMYFRRTDDVGSNPSAQPDPHGFAQMSDWASATGPACLLSGGGTFDFPDAAAHSFTYGLVGSGISRIEIVFVGGGRFVAPIGPPSGLAGFRAWLVERPAGEIDRIEGFDAADQVVATITEIGGDDFGYSIDTC